MRLPISCGFRTAGRHSPPFSVILLRDAKQETRLRWRSRYNTSEWQAELYNSGCLGFDSDDGLLDTKPGQYSNYHPTCRTQDM